MPKPCPTCSQKRLDRQVDSYNKGTEEPYHCVEAEGKASCNAGLDHARQLVNSQEELRRDIEYIEGVFSSGFTLPAYSTPANEAPDLPSYQDSQRDQPREGRFGDKKRLKDRCSRFVRRISKLLFGPMFDDDLYKDDWLD